MHLHTNLHAQNIPENKHLVLKNTLHESRFYIFNFYLIKKNNIFSLLFKLNISIQGSSDSIFLVLKIISDSVKYLWLAVSLTTISMELLGNVITEI